MTTRHTISHADELYAGNAFLQGTVDSSTVGSPDGRRGVLIPHIYVREYGAAYAADDDGILDSFAPSAVIANCVTTCSGVYFLLDHTVGATVIVLDVPRNLSFSCTSAAATEKINVEGKDEYGQVMVETVSQLAAAGTYAYGTKAFKEIDKIYTTWAPTSGLSIGAGPALGLPYHLSNKGEFLGMMADGNFASSATDATIMVTGLALATNATSTAANPDVRGTFTPAGGLAPDASKLITAIMLVDHSTRDKAYGVPQATAIT